MYWTFYTELLPVFVQLDEHNPVGHPSAFWFLSSGIDSFFGQWGAGLRGHHQRWGLDWKVHLSRKKWRNPCVTPHTDLCSTRPVFIRVSDFPGATAQNC